MVGGSGRPFGARAGLEALHQRDWRPRDDATKAMVLEMRFDWPFEPPLSHQQIANILRLRRDTVQQWCKAETDRRRAVRERPAALPSMGGSPVGTFLPSAPKADPFASRYAAYDDATMAVAEEPFSWQEAAFRLAGLVYRADGGIALVFVGVRADGHVHLFGALVTRQAEDAFAIAKRIRALHAWGPLDAVLHSADCPKHHVEHQTHETLGRLLRELPFPLVPGPRSGDFRERLTETLEAGQFTIAAGPDAARARQEFQRAAARRGRGEGPAITALCYVLHHLQKLQGGEDRRWQRG